MKRLTAAFLCCNAQKIDYVYGDERVRKIASLCDLKTPVYAPADVDAGRLTDVDVLFSTWGMVNFTSEQLAKLPRLQAVFYAAGATDYFCRPLFERGVRVFSAWKANAIPVAEFVTAQILLGLKNYFALSAATRERHAFGGNGFPPAGPGTYGARVALLGAGAISTRIQELLKNFHVEVIVVPSRAANRTIPLEEAFATSQVVSNHFPDRDDNAGVLNGKLFRLLPPNAVFINTGRGRQVNEAELIEVLEKRPDLTALLDVTYPEPPVAGSKLYTLPNVHLSPHIAGSLNDEVRRMADCMIEEFLRYLNGEPAKWEVSPDMLLTSK